MAGGLSTNSVGHSKAVRRSAKGLEVSGLAGRMGFIRDGQPLLCLFLLANRSETSILNQQCLFRGIGIFSISFKSAIKTKNK